METLPDYVLYVRPFHAPSLTAMKLAGRNPHIQLCNADKMISYESWLTGVPTLLDRKNSVVDRGSKCLLKLQTLCPLITPFPPSSHTEIGT
jgi:hypothetical protein